MKVVLKISCISWSHHSC